MSRASEVSGANDLTIRPAARADLPALLAIETAAFPGDRLSARALRYHLASPINALVVAERAGEVAGYALVHRLPRGRAARLYSIAVRPGTEAAGVGSALLAAAEEEARRRGAPLMRLEVRADNARASALYERRGYRLIGEEADYYDDGLAARRYEKALDGEGAGTD